MKALHLFCLLFNLPTQNSEEPDKGKVDAAAVRLDAAIAGLRWVDTKYPDPADLPVQNTLPNPYKFFGSDQVVTSNADWTKRRTQILDLAQFYEYGYKPSAPDKQEIKQIKHINVGDNVLWFTWMGVDYFQKATVTQEQVTIAITVGSKTSDLSFTVYQPTTAQLNSSGHTSGPVPMVLSYDGDNATYRNAGFAVVSVPQPAVATGAQPRTPGGRAPERSMICILTAATAWRLSMR